MAVIIFLCFKSTQFWVEFLLIGQINYGAAYQGWVRDLMILCYINKIEVWLEKRTQIIFFFLVPGLFGLVSHCFVLYVSNLLLFFFQGVK